MEGVGTNRYAYAGNDPVNKSDANGHFLSGYEASWDQFTRSLLGYSLDPLGPSEIAISEETKQKSIDFGAKVMEADIEVLSNLAGPEGKVGTRVLKEAVEYSVLKAKEYVDSHISVKCSLAPETLVMTNSGPVQISKIKVGDLVLARNEISGLEAWRKVTKTIENDDPDTTKITLVGDLAGSEFSETIVADGRHPFFVVGKGFVAAKDLEIGQTFLLVHNKIARVSAHQYFPTHVLHAFNLEVDTDHTFFIGQSQVWVHNACRTPPKDLPKGVDQAKLVSNPKHHPNSTSSEPKNVKDLYENSVVGKNKEAWAKDEKGALHRFSPPSNGESHWNGSTEGQNGIKSNNIPQFIKDFFGVKG